MQVQGEELPDMSALDRGSALVEFVLMTKFSEIRRVSIIISTAITYDVAIQKICGVPAKPFAY